MNVSELDGERAQAQREFAGFVNEHVVPIAGIIDERESLPEHLLVSMTERGYWGALVPREYSGREMDAVSFGLLCEQIGRGSASLLSVFTVHTMLTQALLRFGSREQRERWVPALAQGRCFGAFALSEPAVGSDASGVQSRATRTEAGFILDGHKKWVSFGQVARVFLVFARCDGEITAFLVEEGSPGLEVRPTRGMLGFRGAMLAELRLSGCNVARNQVIGQPGAGWSFVANAALAHGRFCVAWGCVGLARAALDASASYALRREQFGAKLAAHQLVAEMISEMAVSARAAELLCLSAAQLREARDPEWIAEIGMAKYFAARAAAHAATHAVQIHGANGASSEYPVERYFRDAKIMELIEGTTQLQQLLIAKHALQKHEAGAVPNQLVAERAAWREELA